jgi:S-phase kinase-associated protein 1
MSTELLFKLESGFVIHLSQKAVEQSVYLSDLASQATDPAEEIALQGKISKEVMEVVKEFLEHYASKSVQDHSKLKKPLPSGDLIEGGFNDFDRELVKTWDQKFAVDVLNAANYLNISSLLELAAARIGSIIKSTSIEDLMKQVGITEFTPEWMDKVRKENPWCKSIQKDS